MEDEREAEYYNGDNNGDENDNFEMMDRYDGKNHPEILLPY